MLKRNILILKSQYISQLGKLVYMDYASNSNKFRWLKGNNQSQITEFIENTVFVASIFIFDTQNIIAVQ